MESIKKLLSLGIDLIIFIGSFALASALLAKVIDYITQYFQLIV